MEESTKLKMPDEFTELTYEDGELSGSGYERLSGNRRWTVEDTLTVLQAGGYFIGGMGVTVLMALGLNMCAHALDMCAHADDVNDAHAAAHAANQAYSIGSQDSTSSDSDEINDQGVGDGPGAGDVTETLIFEN